ncbi:MAG: integration host factor subunit beta [Prevotellaceae bacterium]|nr:integration host factor subunit beta [Prevotellaceae bacterium]MCD8284791.1 integration host factor subunit beta [Prevotellaceae bacterium]MCD8304033.1 integration host factor subunit beta [Prevotellaceae bacterium]
MTKIELVKAIAKETGVDQPTASVVVEAMMRTIKDAVIEGDTVYLRGFGTFGLKRRAEKTARNIARNTSLIVPAHNIPSFKPCREFQEAVAQLK